MCEQRVVDVFSVGQTALRCGDKKAEALDIHAMTAIVTRSHRNPTTSAPTNLSFGLEISWSVLCGNGNSSLVILCIYEATTNFGRVVFANAQDQL